ncbi:GNAT family N-acetyltransferase [Neobacillus sp. PS3-34]|uniref:GNAT family N-acetyltransferase n=1 Tax=Neobacillus sp. PS3-34 TaxID=3070678 RepID=UPI0027E020D3|nr:GNAT family N-acetyltransferase [Neobacillus sp. PS3-34]WML48709.1 GNAT family N-acetyltransferase [Neobacillus sp. PS3-34]
MFNFEKVNKDNFNHVVEIVNSNEEYNRLENGSPYRTEKEIKEEFLYEDSNRHTYYIKDGTNFIGLIDYIDKNPNDGHTWLGLLMTHGSYHKQGYGKRAYQEFEYSIKNKGCRNLRIGIIPQNHNAEKFWKSIDFKFYEQKKSTTGLVVNCYEKQL